MDNKEVRRRNVAWLVARHGGPTLFGDAIDRAQTLVTRWVGGKNIGDKMARHIEAALGHPPGWLDTPRWSDESAVQEKASEKPSPESRFPRLDHAIITQAKRWVQAEETLAGPYPRDDLVDQVLAVYELMLESGGVLSAEQRAARFSAAQGRARDDGERNLLNESG